MFVFRKFCVLCFLITPVLRFAFLPYYLRIKGQFQVIYHSKVISYFGVDGLYLDGSLWLQFRYKFKTLTLDIFFFYQENDIKAAITLLKKELTEILTKETPDIPTEEIDTKSKEKWESLSPEEQNEYKERAKTDEELMDIYECAWLDCEYQFEDLQDLMVHVMEGPHIIKSGMYDQVIQTFVNVIRNVFNLLSANPTKWSDTLRPFYKYFACGR